MSLAAAPTRPNRPIARPRRGDGRCRGGVAPPGLEQPAGTCARNELTQSPDWLLTWWRTYGGLEDRQLRLGFFYEADRLIGLAPLLHAATWYRGCLPFRRLELAGLRRTGCKRASIPITSASWPSAAPRPGSPADWSRRCGRCFRAVGRSRSADDVGRHRNARIAGRCVSRRQAAGGDDSHGPRSLYSAPGQLGGLPGEPLGQRPAQHGATLKAFDQWADGTTKLECATSSADLEGARKSCSTCTIGAGPATATRESSACRITLIFTNASCTVWPSGQLELIWLTARGEPVAVLYGWVWDNKVYAYQTGRRTDLPANLSPGGVLFAHAIRRAIEQGRRELDLLADEAFFKRQLTPIPGRWCACGHALRWSRQCAASADSATPACAGVKEGQKITSRY